MIIDCLVAVEYYPSGIVPQTVQGSSPSCCERALEAFSMIMTDFYQFESAVELSYSVYMITAHLISSLH